MKWRLFIMTHKKSHIKTFLQITISLIVFFLTAYLFFCQATTVDNTFKSDLPSHIKFAQSGVGYSILYFIMGLLLKLTGGNVLSIAILEALLIVGTGWITYAILLKALPKHDKILLFTLSFGLIFLSTIYVPTYHPYYYVKSFITQPWHNITYFGMRFLALLTIYTFFDAYNNYLQGITLKQWFKISIPLLLATAIKPNFLISFSFTLLFILIVDFFKNFFDIKKFINMIKMGTTVFPACAVLLVQAVTLYAPTETGAATSGIIITWGELLFREGTLALILKSLCGFSFPVLIYLFCRKSFGKNEKFAYLMFIITFLQAHMLGESGIRANHGNFYWGMFSSSYVLFLYAIIGFLKHQQLEKHSTIRTLFNIICWCLLILHFISGLSYFHLLLQGVPSWSI